MIALILGGYGNFGARICRALSNDKDLQLMVAGRSLQRSIALANELGGSASGVAIDIDSPNLTAKFRALKVDLVIHTVGPFQHQGYSVSRCAAEAGAHYIDLADGRRFVCDFAKAMDETFRAAGRVGICGASTVPALSSAVVGHLCRGWQRTDAIDMCIAPAQTAPRGRATLAAVLSYCGEPIQVWNQGRWQTHLGWANPSPVQFARMPPRSGALCDIPDLELFPTHFSVRQRVQFRAALEVGLTQRAFAVLADLRSKGLMPRLTKLAGLLNRAARAFDFMGTALGGMVVTVEGVDSMGLAIQRSWHLAADHDHGPEIPCMAAVLLARRLARGENLPSGAVSCLGLLDLAEFESEFERWGMVTDFTAASTAPAPAAA